jgi:NAD dependent epimerase/dehydratase
LATPPSPSCCALTGAGGFIGSHLAEALLKRGWRVRALVHYNALDRRGHLEEVERLGRESGADWRCAGRLEVVAGDVQDPRCLRDLARGCDAVFHLAALIGIPYSYVAPQAYVNVNVQGTLNLLEACREEGVGRVLVTSTSEVYGTALRVPIDEEHPLQAQSPYAATKIAADKLAEAYHRAFGLPVVTVRPFNAYGPRQSARAVVPTIVAQALAPDCPVIRLGALDPVRDLTYVADTAAAFVALAEAPVENVVGRVFNAGQGHGVTIRELAGAIQKLAGTEKPVEVDDARVRPTASEVERLIGNADAIRQAAGWTPRVGLEEGLKLTIDWIRPRLDQYRAGEYVR